MGPLFLLLHLPWIANRVANILYARTQSRLDHETPDTLPETAGQWLERKLVALGLDVRSIVTNDRAKASRNAFHPTDQMIQLTEEVYFKRDPAYWAIAVHELGHARFRIRRPRRWSLYVAIGRLKSFLVSLGLSLGLGNMLYGIAHVTDVAFVLLAVALALHVVKIGNEMVASAFAFEALEQEVHVCRRRDARRGPCDPADRRRRVRGVHGPDRDRARVLWRGVSRHRRPWGRAQRCVRR